MNDQFKEVTTRSWGSRIINSIKGVIIGFLMFVISFGVLYWNEGRVDVSKIAKTAVEIESTTQAQAEADKQLISTTGVLKSDEIIGDTYLKEGSYFSIKRNVEMYAWKEEKEEKSTSNVGGSETVETTYTYKKEWTDYPQNSSSFKKSEEHANPQMSLNTNLVTVKTADIGTYKLTMNQIELPEYQSIQLNNDNVILADDVKLGNEQYLFKGKGSVSTPEIGDIRISYSVINNPIDTATVFGKLDSINKTIAPFYGEKNTKLYRIFEGTRDTAIATMKTEYTMSLWILRGLGFLLMWLGLMALFAPISVFLDVLPIFGSIGRAGVGLLTFIASFILSIVTILVSMIIHNVIVLVVVILGIIIAAILYMKNKRKNK